MKLMTKEVQKAFEKYPLGSQDGHKDATVVVVKFFDPTGRWTFYATEGEQDGDDFMMFGFCQSPLGSDCDELGYASLNEISKTRGRLGLSMERDRWFPVAKKTLGDVPSITPYWRVSSVGS